MSFKLSIRSLAAGLLFPLAFAPIAMPGMAFLSVGIFYYLLESHQRQSFKMSYLYGLGKYGLGVSWVFVSIYQFSNAPWPISFIATVLFIAFLALFELLLAYLYIRMRQSASPMANAFIFAFIASLMEWLRSVFLTGFPWLLFAYSQIDTPLKHFAPLIGTFGLAFIAYLISALLATGIKSLEDKRQNGFVPLTLALIPFVMTSFISDKNYTTKDTIKPLRVALVQGNIPRNSKWQAKHFDTIVERYYDLSQQNQDVDLIVWPETAIPAVSDVIKPLLNNINLWAINQHTHILMGLPGSNPDGSYSNSLMLFGEHQARYDKQHLVPFGEFTPFNFLKPILSYFDVPMSHVTKGQHSDTIFNVNGISLFPSICYEIAYTDSLYSALAKANMLVSVTDDAWFGHSLAKAQHTEIARMRSLQSGRYQLIASNNGITTIIDNHGNIQSAINEDSIGVLKGRAYSFHGLTPWARIGGDKTVVTFLFIGLILCVLRPLYRLNISFIRPIARLIKKAYALRLKLN